MKYIAIVDDNALIDIRELRMVVVTPKGCQDVSLKPVIRPTLTLEDGQSIYLHQGHIDAMREYEEIAVVKRTVDEMSGKLGES